MNITSPTVTVRNTDTPDWLVTIEGALDGDETVTFTVRVPRSEDSYVSLAKQAIARAILLLQDHLGTYPPDAP